PTKLGPNDHDLPIEAPRPEERRVEHVGPVGGHDHDDAFVAIEAVHLAQQLIDRLLALVVPTTEPRATMPADSVDFVNEHDAWGIALALLEEITNAAVVQQHGLFAAKERFVLTTAEVIHIAIIRKNLYAFHDCALALTFAVAHQPMAGLSNDQV